MIVLVTGAPASGKSTLAAELAPALGLPLLAKDTIKAALVDSLGVVDVEDSRLLGRAAAAALLALAREARVGVLDSVWVDRPRQLPALRDLGVAVEVHCTAPAELLRERYAARAAGRAFGHFDLERDDAELWSPSRLAPLDGGWPVLRVDTTTRPYVPHLVALVRRAEK